MSDSLPVPQKPLQIISLGATGLAIGWLAGLSLSPVVGTIIAAVLGLVGGVMAGFSSQNGPKHIADARPIALVVVGIAIASTLGMLTRDYWLPPPNGAVPGTTGPRRTTGLFAAPAPSACQDLRIVSNEDLRFAFRSSSDTLLQAWAEEGLDDSLLVPLREILCPSP